MKNILLNACVAAAFTFSAVPAAMAQDTLATQLTVEAVSSTCSAPGNTDACLAAIRTFVAQVKAAGGSTASQQQEMNQLVVALAEASSGNTALSSQIASALDTIASEASDIVNVAAITAISSTVRSGETVQTASLSSLASPG